MTQGVGEIRSQGADLVAIGNGTALMARDFLESQELAFPVFTDPRREVYKAAGLRRGMGFGLSSLSRGKRARDAGHRQSAVKGDPWQQGGALIITPEPRVAWKHVDSGLGDHADLDAVLAALEAL